MEATTAQTGGIFENLDWSCHPWLCCQKTAKGCPEVDDALLHHTLAPITSHSTLGADTGGLEISNLDELETASREGYASRC